MNDLAVDELLEEKRGESTAGGGLLCYRAVMKCSVSIQRRHVVVGGDAMMSSVGGGLDTVMAPSLVPELVLSRCSLGKWCHQ